MLRVVSGTANVGKTGVIYERLVEVARNRGRAVLVLPSTADVTRARRELSQRAPIGLRITTFDGLIRALWEQYGDERQIISSQLRRLALASQARASGLTPSFARFAGDMVEALTEQAGLQWREQEPQLDPRVQALVGTIRGYATYLANTNQIELAECAHLLAAEEALSIDIVAIHRFNSLTPSHVALVKGLSSRGDVVVSATTRPDVPGPRPFLDPLEADDEVVLQADDTRTSASLVALTSSLFDTSSPLEPSDYLRVILAEGEEAEAEAIVEAVVAALEQGYATASNRVAITFRDPSRIAGPLRQAFERAGIAADFDMGMGFAETPFGRAIINLIEFGRWGRRSSLLNFMRSPYAPLEPGEARQLEHNWRRRGTMEAESLLRDVRRHTRLGRTVDAFCLSGADGLCAQSCARLAQVVEALAARHLTARSDDALGDARSLSAVLSLLTDITESDIAFELSDLHSVLKETVVASRPDEREGHVQVVPIGRLRGRRFETVIVGGLNEGEFPRRARENFIEGSLASRVLRAFGGHEEQGDSDEAERDLFYEVVTRASRQLVLLAQTTDADGEQLALSPFLSMLVARMAPAQPEEARHFGEVPNPLSVFERERLQAAVRDADPQDERNIAARNRAVGRRIGLSADRRTELISCFTPSELETYLTCPYRWFYQKVLRPRELDRAFDARSEGDFAHRLLAETHRTLIAGGVSRPGTPTLQAAQAALQQARAAIEKEAGPAADLDEATARNRAFAWAARVVEEDAHSSDDFTVRYVELDCGSEQVGIDLGAGLVVRGRVDRVDVDGSGRAIVVDYKRSCGASHGAARMLSAGKVQMALYIQLVEQVLGVQVVGGLYRGLSEPTTRGMALQGVLTRSFVKGDELDQAQFSELRTAAIEAAANAAASISRGDIAPRPIAESVCVTCDAKRVCGWS